MKFDYRFYKEIEIILQLLNQHKKPEEITIALELTELQYRKYESFLIKKDCVNPSFQTITDYGRLALENKIFTTNLRKERRKKYIALCTLIVAIITLVITIISLL